MSADFKANKEASDPYYDLFDDYPLIEASFAQQYGIRLRMETDMSWDEFSSLISGLNEQTPLGNYVRIRSETDASVIKDFTKAERKIYNDWKKKGINKVKDDDFGKNMKMLEDIFRGL